MKLNTDLIFQELSESHSLDLTGTPSEALHLKSPTICTQPLSEFQNNMIYISTPENLQKRPKVPADCLLICTGESIRLTYYKERCPVITVKDKCDPFTIYMEVQELFHRYGDWNDRLFEFYQNNADIQSYIDASVPIFRELISVLDANFGTIAYALPDGAEPPLDWEENKDGITKRGMEDYLEEAPLSLDVHGPTFLKLKNAQALYVNLFDASDKYIGCFWVNSPNRKYQPGVGALAAHLAAILEKAISRMPALMVSTHSSVRQALQNLLSDQPVDPSQRWLLDAFGLETRYLCITLHATSNVQMPPEYISNTIEREFPNSVAFPLQEHVVGYLNLHSISNENNDYVLSLNQKLNSILYSLKLHCGISNEIIGFADARTAYLQAEIAHENGAIARPEASFNYFSSYALMEMISNSLGGLPIETYFPEGIRKLMEHDRNSDISYLETLTVFLNENMNYSSAARILFVHRSTLIDRIERIKREMSLDLDDPNERLQLQMLFKAMELEEAIFNRQ